MPRKHRPLTVTYRVDRAPKGTTNRAIIRAMLAGIEEGDFELPEGYHVTLAWQNKGKEWREKDFTEAMTESTEGFRSIVAWYLDGLLAKAQEPPSKSDQLEGLRKEYEQRDQAMRLRAVRENWSDPLTAARRHELVRWYREQQKRIRDGK